MKTDIEIAQSTPLKPIMEIAETAGVDEKYIEQYGKNKAKINFSLLNETTNEDGKLILVTAITPTPAGEGTLIPQRDDRSLFGFFRFAKRNCSERREKQSKEYFQSKRQRQTRGKRHERFLECCDMLF